MQVAIDSLQANAIHVLSGDDAVRSESDAGISVRIRARSSSRTSHTIHSAVRDTRTPTAQYVVHSDLTKVLKLPHAKSMPEHNQYSLLESSMAITVAGMSPSLNGDSHKARSLSADESARSMEDGRTSNWGFKSEGISAFTGDEGSTWNSAERRRQPSPEAFTNPYIEMRRKRADMRMIRYQLASYGQLPAPHKLHQSLERRIRTPDRECCLNISQVSPSNEWLLSPKLPSSEKDQLELTPEDHETLLVHRDDRDSSEFFMARAARSSAKELAESLGLGRSRGAVGIQSERLSRLCTPELPNYISRRRLDSTKEQLIERRNGEQPPSMHKFHAAAISSSQSWPLMQGSIVDIQPSAHHMHSTNDSTRSLLSTRTAPPALRASAATSAAAIGIAPSSYVQARGDHNRLSHPTISTALQNAPEITHRTSKSRRSRSGNLSVIVGDSMSPWDGGVGEPSPIKSAFPHQNKSLLQPKAKLSPTQSLKEYVAVEEASKSSVTQRGELWLGA